MESGKLLLTRQDETFIGGFCVVNEELPVLKKERAFLHPSEVDYFETLEWPKRQLSYLLGRLSAKLAIEYLTGLSDYCATWIKVGIFKQPIVINPKINNVQVSISHCDTVAIAIAFPEEHPMGVDIEEINEDKKEAILGQLNSNEIETYGTLTLTEITIYTINWTTKEALSKVLKTGLTTDFKLLCVQSIHESGGIYTSSFTNYHQYKAISTVISNHVCTVIVPKKTEIDLSLIWEGLKKELRNKY